MSLGGGRRYIRRGSRWMDGKKGSDLQRSRSGITPRLRSHGRHLRPLGATAVVIAMPGDFVLAPCPPPGFCLWLRAAHGRRAVVCGGMLRTGSAVESLWTCETCARTERKNCFGHPRARKSLNAERSRSSDQGADHRHARRPHDVWRPPRTGHTAGRDLQRLRRQARAAQRRPQRLLSFGRALRLPVHQREPEGRRRSDRPLLASLPAPRFCIPTPTVVYSLVLDRPQPSYGILTSTTSTCLQTSPAPPSAPRRRASWP